jgi:hypothetical protein
MAIVDYTSLQAGIASWLARDDLAANIPDFITLFEAAVNRRLRVRAMETSVNLTTSGGAVALPADYLAWRRLTWLGSTHVDLDYVHPSWLQAKFPSAPAGTPHVFTIEGATLKVRNVDDTTPLEFDYFQKLPALSVGNPTNWLLAAHPDVYLFGALVEATVFTKDWEQATAWKSRRDELFDEIERLDAKTRGPAMIRLMGATP